MWSRDAKRLAAPALVGAALLLGGCEVRPMYADPQMFGRGGGTPAGAALALVQVAPIQEREGVQLRNDLIFALAGGGREVDNPRYRLDVQLSKTSAATTTLALSGLPSASQVTLNATYSLVRIDTGERLYLGRAASRANFDRTVQRFSNVRAEREAEDRAAREIAGMIRNALAAYFARTG
jgi:LPS-assembly lipoprotein